MNVTIPCICPPKDGQPRHDEDTVTLRDKLGFQAVAAIRWQTEIMRQTDPRASFAELFGAVTELYILYGIEEWTVVDDKGKLVEVSKPAIRDRLLTTDQAQIVGDVADGQYAEVMRPLLQPASTSSPPTPKIPSTSHERNTSPRHRTRSKPSSISTIPTAATETTTSSLDGDSRSSPNSVTAA